MIVGPNLRLAIVVAAWIAAALTLTSAQTSILTIPSTRPMFMTISCGSGTLSIAMKDGTVTTTGNCNPDDAAMNFWSAVKRMTPKECP